MPAVQTTYSTTMRRALAGMKADMSPETIVSRVVKVGALAWGAVAVQAATGDTHVKPAAASAAFIGIALMDPTVAPITVPVTVDAYQIDDVAQIIISGTVWVQCSVTAAAGDLAYYVPATGVITNVLTANTLMGMFETSTTGAGLVVLRLNR